MTFNPYAESIAYDQRLQEAGESQERREDQIQKDVSIILGGGEVQAGGHEWTMRDVIDHAINAGKYDAELISQLLVEQYSGADNRKQLKEHLEEVATDLLEGIIE